MEAPLGRCKLNPDIRIMERPLGLGPQYRPTHSGFRASSSALVSSQQVAQVPVYPLPPFSPPGPTEHAICSCWGQVGKAGPGHRSGLTCGGHVSPTQSPRPHHSPCSANPTAFPGNPRQPCALGHLWAQWELCASPCLCCVAL